MKTKISRICLFLMIIINVGSCHLFYNIEEDLHPEWSLLDSVDVRLQVFVPQGVDNSLSYNTAFPYTPYLVEGSFWYQIPQNEELKYYNNLGIFLRSYNFDQLIGANSEYSMKPLKGITPNGKIVIYPDGCDEYNKFYLFDLAKGKISGDIEFYDAEVFYKAAINETPLPAKVAAAFPAMPDKGFSNYVPPKDVSMEEAVYHHEEYVDSLLCCHFEKILRKESPNVYFFNMNGHAFHAIFPNKGIGFLMKKYLLDKSRVATLLDNSNLPMYVSPIDTVPQHDPEIKLEEVGAICTHADPFPGKYSHRVDSLYYYRLSSNSDTLNFKNYSRLRLFDAQKRGKGYIIILENKNNCNFFEYNPRR